MSDVRLTTYSDLISHVLDYLGAATDPNTERRARRAVQTAYREMGTSRRWSYHMQRGRIVTVASQTEGTIAYDHTGGANERMVTLTDSTWPSWAAYGTILIDDIAYDVATRESDTVITLNASANPGADVAAEETYTLYRDTYVLPGDFISGEEFVVQGQSGCVSFCHPAEWLALQRLNHNTGIPAAYCLTGDPNYFGALSARIFPAPDDVYEIDFIYQRRPRSLTLDEYETGTVTATSASTTLTGSGTTWTSSMVGSVIRFSEDAVTNPTGPEGASPALLERVVSAYTSATSLTLDSAPGVDLAGVKYSISDPADIESQAQLTFLLRECERQARIMARMKPTVDEERQYAEARTRAWEVDSRDFSRRAAGGYMSYRPRLADMRAGPDVS
jgi:hypothetical protein